MTRIKIFNLGCLGAICGIFLLATSGFGYEINDKLSIGGIVAGEWQYQDVNDAPDFDSGRKGRHGLPARDQF